MRDKRRFERVDEKWQVNYRILEEDHFAGGPIHQYTLNISGGGVSFTTEEEIDPGTPIALELKSAQFPAPVLAMANVVRCKRARHNYEVAAEFWWVGWKNDTAQRTISDYINTTIEGEKANGDLSL